ncbi:exonuclease SbcCD subunit D [Candidatus Woesearchaeota archaeon]|nr:exonuclease SbcCD subunit D [Candidatus Woesearchaeota archaeon]
MVKFAHLADCHIGGWRDEKLKNLNLQSFIFTIDKCIEENVDFILIAGDLFNTSLPGIDFLKEVVKQLKKLKQINIPVYIIPGSHDFSPSGKTMLSVLEEAELIINVVKGNVEEGKLKLNFTIDPKTGAKITGLLGKKGMLEKSYYNNLVRENLEQEDGFKIFMFHSAITELKPKELENMDSMALSLLPKNFNYYAAGHVHIVKNFNIEGYENIVYPGPTFPNNFYELETLKQGGFYIYYNGNINYIPIQLKEVLELKIDCSNKTNLEIEEELLNFNKDVNDKIILIRLSGIMHSGKPSDIDFKKIIHSYYEKGAFFVMKNTFRLKTKKFEEIKVQESSVDELENKLVNEHAGQNNELSLEVEKEKEFTKKLMSILSEEKNEDEKNDEYDGRILDSMNQTINEL